MGNAVIRLDQRARQIELAGLAGGIRLDANETATFARQLEQIETRIFEVKYPTGHGIELVPLLRNINVGAKSYTYRVFDYVGEAVRAANYSDDAPRVNIQGFEVTAKLYGYRASYGYSIEDMRAAAMANLDLEVREANAARNVIARKLDESIWVGDSVVGVTGLANNANVSTVSPVTGTWSSASGPQILADLNKLVMAALIASKGEEDCDTVVMSITAYGYVSTKRMGDVANLTVLEQFLKDNPKIKRVEKSYRLELANAGGNGGRVIAYMNDPEKLEALVPIEFEVFAPIAKGMAFSVDVHGKFGGVAIRYPASVRYMDGCA
jgi:hypothetical protein